MSAATDLLVLGGGPAGVAISLLMARRGYQVEILDAAFFPREKICGEFLNPQAVRWLRAHGLSGALLAENPYEVHGMKISDLEGRSFTGHYHAFRETCGYAIMRRNFDSLLISQAEKAGVAVRQGFKAERLVFDGDNVSGVAGIDPQGERFEKRSRLVIGADGRNNLIGRTFGWIRGIPELRKYAFQTYFDNVPELSHHGEVHMIRDGYIGIAPLTERLANVALVIDEKAWPSDDTDRAGFLQERIHTSLLAGRFEGLTAISGVNFGGPLAFEVKQASGHRTLLVGDTCGFIDPFTGEGINYAFLSADLAEPVLDAALQTGRMDDAALFEYDRARKTVFDRKFQMARLVQKAIGSQKFSSYLVRKFAERIDLADTVVSAVGAAVPVERVMSLSFLLKLVFS